MVLCAAVTMAGSTAARAQIFFITPARDGHPLAAALAPEVGDDHVTTGQTAVDACVGKVAPKIDLSGGQVPDFHINGSESDKSAALENCIKSKGVSPFAAVLQALRSVFGLASKKDDTRATINRMNARIK